MLFSNLYCSAGKQIFDTYCVTCHSLSMSAVFNSPAVHDIEKWEIRKTDALNRFVIKNNIDVSTLSNEDKYKYIIKELLDTAISGTNKGMPAKGTCSNCTDIELISAIEFMFSKQ